jgi:hypothetical protein
MALRPEVFEAALMTAVKKIKGNGTKRADSKFYC